MITLVLAAGYGTRLSPLTDKTPKPLLPLGDRPIANHILDPLLAASPTPGRMIVVTNALHHAAYQEWKDRYYAHAPVSILNDGTTSNEGRLGAIRDIELAVRTQNIAEDLLVVAGDNYFTFPLSDFTAFAARRRASVVLVPLPSADEAAHYGTAAVDPASGRVTAFREKSPQPVSNLISTCIYYFRSDTIPLLTQYVRSGLPADPPGRFIQWLQEHDEVHGYVARGEWFDIGNIEAYRRANAHCTVLQNTAR